MMSIPFFNYDMTGIDWPWLGPLVAWTLAALLIASVLSLLRCADRSQAASASGAASPTTPPSRSVADQPPLSKVA